MSRGLQTSTLFACTGCIVLSACTGTSDRVPSEVLPAEAGATVRDGAPAEANPFVLGVWSDPSFGSQGYVSGAAASWLPAGVAIAADGSIVVAGPTNDPTVSPTESVRRFAADGTLDGSFGSATGALVNVAADPLAQSVAALPDGRIEVFGAASLAQGPGAFAMRFKADGSPDPGFGQRGQWTGTAAGQGRSGLWAGDGSLYAIGADAVARVAANGVLDANFAAGMRVPGGSIGVIGPAAQTFLAADGVHVTRYSSIGTVDPSFGSQGSLDVPFGTHAAPGSIRAMAADAQGNVLVAGLHNEGDLLYVDAVRLTNGGSADAAFAHGGVVSVRASGGPVGAAIRTDGRALVWTDAGELLGYKTDGTLDDALGPGGLVDLEVLGTVLGAALDAQERLVVVGIATNIASPEWFVRRYLLR